MQFLYTAEMRRGIAMLQHVLPSKVDVQCHWEARKGQYVRSKRTVNFANLRTRWGSRLGAARQSRMQHVRCADCGKNVSIHQLASHSQSCGSRAVSSSSAFPPPTRTQRSQSQPAPHWQPPSSVAEQSVLVTCTNCSQRIPLHVVAEHSRVCCQSSKETPLSAAAPLVQTKVSKTPVVIRSLPMSNKPPKPGCTAPKAAGSNGTYAS